MGLIQKLNDKLITIEKQYSTTEVPLEKLRITDRNISINVINPQDTEEQITEIIKYQNNYFTGVSSKYINHLPDLNTAIETVQGQKLNLRTYLLNIKNSNPESGEFHIFTQVDQGLTIRTNSPKKLTSKKGVILIFATSTNDKATNLINNISTRFREDIKKE